MMGKKLTDLEVIKKTNQIGTKSIPVFKCTNPYVGKTKGGIRLIEVMCVVTKETKVALSSKVFLGQNPFKLGKFTNFMVIKKIDAVGKKASPAYRCTNPLVGFDKKGNRIIEVECLKTKEKKQAAMSNVLRSLKHQYNPFFLGKAKNLEIQEEINRIGLKSSPQYICTNPMVKFYKKNRIVEIQCIKTKEKRLVTSNSIINNGNNTFNTDKNRVEINVVHPMYERLFKKHKIEFQKNFTLGRKMIDFVFKLPNKNKWDGLEVKQSKKYHSYSTKQIAGYRQKAKLKQYNLDRVLLSDPLGNHRQHGSISIKELEMMLAG